MIEQIKQIVNRSVTYFVAQDENELGLVLSKGSLLNLIGEVERLQKENNGLKAFHNYFSELNGDGLEIANWHKNGDFEAFDNFFESAELERKKVSK